MVASLWILQNDWNDTRMLPTFLKKSSKQRPTKQQLYCHLPPIIQTILVKQEKHAWHCLRARINSCDIHLWTPTHGHLGFSWPAKTYIHQLSADTGYHLEDRPRVLVDSYGWREKVKRIRALGTSWWWWWWWPKPLRPQYWLFALVPFLWLKVDYKKKCRNVLFFLIR